MGREVVGRTRQPARSVRQLHKGQIRLQHNALPVCAGYPSLLLGTYVSMRTIYVVAAVGMAIADRAAAIKGVQQSART